MIAVDWGSTHLRVWFLDGKGAVTDERDALVAQLPGVGFEARLLGLIEGWPADAPILACGMIGARHGWVEAPYVDLPSGLGRLVAGLVRAPSRRSVTVVPGLAKRGEAGRLIDVMRGEETLAIGADMLSGEVALCPGTHSKWILAGPSGLEDFATFMTGEVFGLLARHSVLSQSLGEARAQPGAAFRSGVRDALARPALIQQLFSIRVAHLDEMQPADAASRLSGLLIGAEISAARNAFGERPIVLIADGPMAALYSAALSDAGLNLSRCVPASVAAVSGLYRIWSHR